MLEIFYDVALSYASEDRDYVRKVAAALRKKEILFFYDEYTAAGLWGENLEGHLTEVFRDKSTFVVVFISKAYASKVWTNLEASVAQSAAEDMGRSSYVLPVRFDDTELASVSKEIVFIDLRKTSADELATLIGEKLARSPKARPRLLQRALLRRVLDLSWQMALVYGILAGLVLIGWSELIGVGDLYYPPLNDPNARQVGYRWALNWSVAYALFLPVAAALLLTALHEINSLFRHLNERGMFRLKSWVSPDSAGDALRIAWLRGNRWRRLFIAVLGVGFAVWFSIGEWYPNNFRRLYQYTKTDGINDVDWGLACNFVEPQCSPVQRLANVGLDFAAFAAEGFYVAIFFIFLVYAVDFARILSSSAADLEIEFWPALLEGDPRRGFEEFEPLLNRCLTIVLVGYVLAYLVRLENLYLTSAEPHDPMQFSSTGLTLVRSVATRSLFEFVSADFATTIQSINWQNGIMPFISSVAATFFKLDGWTRQTRWSGVGVLLLYVVVVFVLLTTVCLLAVKAKRNAHRYYASVSAKPLFGLTIESERKLAADMNVWPIGWLRLNRLMAWTGIALVSLVFYRVGALVAVMTLIYLSYRAIKVALPRS